MSDTGPPKPGPSQPAENWGRRDSIRAGAVSGPWRSGPRATPPAAPPPQGSPPKGSAPPVLPRVTPAAQVPPPAREPAVARPAPVLQAPASAPSHPRQQTRAPAPLPKRGRRPLALGIAGGLAAALALVVGALLLRPDTDPPAAPVAAPPPQAEAPAAPNSGKVAAASAPSPEDAAALSGITEIRLRLGPGFPDDRRDALVAALKTAGLTGVTVEAVPVAVAASRVGYYLPADRAAAEALARLVAPNLGGRSINARDYQGLMPSPVAGRLDLWISD